MWWTRREQSYRTVAYLIANSIASIIGPILAYGIGHATQTIHAYKAIFLSLGAISLGIQPLVWFMLPNSPATAKFLRHGNDRLIAVERLRENNTGTKVSTISVGPGWLDLGRPQSGNGTNSGRRCAT